MVSRIVVVMLLLILVLAAPAMAQDDAPFTIQADAAHQEALSALYGAAGLAGEPVFVEEGGDILVTDAPESLADYILPDLALVNTSDNAEAEAFIEFSVSPDGQQVLIDLGLLPDSVTVTDQAGNDVTIPQPVRGIVSAHGPSIYFIYGVGAEDTIISANYLGLRDAGEPVAIMEAIDPDFPDKVNFSLTTREVNVEEIALLAPDVVFTNPRSPWIEAVQELEIPVFLFNAESPDLIIDAMRSAGQIFGPNAAAQAEAWIAYYEGVIAQIAEDTAALADEDRVSVLQTGTDPLVAASGDMYQSAIIEAAGGVSVSSEISGFWTDINLEQVVVWNPDMIWVPPYGGASVEAITDSAEWSIVPAVEAGAVYMTPLLVAPWDTPAPDSVLAIIWAANLFYPDLVSLDCATETDYFYSTFYDYTLSSDQIDTVCGN